LRSQDVKNKIRVHGNIKGSQLFSMTGHYQIGLTIITMITLLAVSSTLRAIASTPTEVEIAKTVKSMSWNEYKKTFMYGYERGLRDGLFYSFNTTETQQPNNANYSHGYVDGFKTGCRPNCLLNL
jgi:hypothetical protein